MRSDDARWMTVALDLARRGEGRTRPNPPVGAVVVRNNRIIGRGYHKKAGGPHAEVSAIRTAGRSARGADLFVTLEPCSTHGKTPPCVEAIIAAGISRTVFAVRDPNPEHSGKASRILKRGGVQVAERVCAEAAAELVAPFAKWVTSGRPYVTLKMGMTLDGRVSDKDGRSRWITADAAGAAVQDLRSRSDAVLVGAATAHRDDPSLLCRGRRKNRHFRVVTDSRGTLSPNAQMFTDGMSDLTIVATTDRCSRSRRCAYERTGAQVWSLPTSGGQVSLKALLRKLGKMGMLHVLCEGGGQMACALARGDLVDRYMFFVAPKLLAGDTSTPVLSGPGWRLGHEPELEFVNCERVGRDVLLVAKPRRR